MQLVKNLFNSLIKQKNAKCQNYDKTIEWNYVNKLKEYVPDISTSCIKFLLEHNASATEVETYINFVNFVISSHTTVFGENYYSLINQREFDHILRSIVLTSNYPTLFDYLVDYLNTYGNSLHSTIFINLICSSVPTIDLRYKLFTVRELYHHNPFYFTIMMKRHIPKKHLLKLINCAVRMSCNLNTYTNARHETVLHMLTNNSNDWSLMLLLLYIGVDPNIQNKNGNTVLDKFISKHALFNNTLNCNILITILILNGAKTNILNENMLIYKPWLTSLSFFTSNTFRMTNVINKATWKKQFSLIVEIYEASFNLSSFQL